jgi:hypothetical protein
MAHGKEPLDVAALQSTMALSIKRAPPYHGYTGFQWWSKRRLGLESATFKQFNYGTTTD